jgi:PASTA domain-containing protein
LAAAYFAVALPCALAAQPGTAPAEGPAPMKPPTGLITPYAPPTTARAADELDPGVFGDTTSRSRGRTPLVNPAAPSRPSVAPGARGLPNVIGMDPELAAETLRPFGVMPDLREEFFCGATPGLVWDQQPAAGTPITPNVPVRVIVVPHETTVTVPNLVGHPQSELAADFAKAQLCAGETAQDGEGAGGNVVAMSPAPGTPVRSGTRVSVTLRAATAAAPPVPPSIAAAPAAKNPPPDATPAASATTTKPPATTTPSSAATAASPTVTTTTTQPLPAPPAPSISPQALPPGSPDTPYALVQTYWPLLAVGAATLFALLVFFVRGRRASPLELPPQVRLEGRKNTLHNSVRPRAGRLISAEVELRGVRAAGEQRLQTSAQLIQREQILA